MTMYSSAVELGMVSTYPIRANLGYHSWTPFRQLYEIIVEIENTINNKDYYSQIVWEACRDSLQQIQLAERGNPVLGKLLSHPKIDEIKRTRDAEKTEMEKMGARRLSYEQKFKMAGMSDIYDGVYRFLSLQTHSKLSALMARHGSPYSDEPKFTAFDHGPSEKFLMVTTGAYEALVHISNAIHVKFETGIKIDG